MPSTAPSTSITPPTRRQTVNSLLNSAEVVLSTQTLDLDGGGSVRVSDVLRGRYGYYREPCRTGGTWDICNLLPGGTQNPYQYERSNDPEDLVEWDPFGINVGEICSLMGNPLADNDFAGLSDRLARILDREQSRLIASVLSTGQVNGVDLTFNGGPGLVNWALELETPAFQDITVAPPAADSIVTAMANLIDELCAVTSQGMIHVPKIALPYLNLHDQIRFDSNGRAFTADGDHMIVADCGYSGNEPTAVTSPPFTPPAAGEAWFYATTPVRVFLDAEAEFDVVAYGADNTGSGAGDNNVEGRVQKTAGVDWDHCIHLGVLVDLCQAC